LIVEHGGRVANTAGDSLLLEFTSVVDAVRCSVAFQKGVAERNKDIAEDRRIHFRVGINLGDVVADGDDLLGDGINVAARLEGLSAPGGITLSDEAYRQVRDRLDLAWQDGGEHQVKNIARPLHIWRWVPGD
jgi:adenylate cyclase